MKSDEFIREVDEELQRERLTVLWKRYGGVIITAAVLVVGATAAKVGWDAWTKSRMESRGAAFAELDAKAAAGDPGTAEGYVRLAEELGGGAGAIALLKAAAVKFDAGENEAGVALLEQLEGLDTDPLLSDLGRLLRLLHQLDDADPAIVLDDVEPLVAAASPWRHTAREIKALAAWKAGNEELAREVLRDLDQDATTPAGLRGRAQELLAALGEPVAASVDPS